MAGNFCSGPQEKFKALTRSRWDSDMTYGTGVLRFSISHLMGTSTGLGRAVSQSHGERVGTEQLPLEQQSGAVEARRAHNQGDISRRLLVRRFCSYKDGYGKNLCNRVG